MGRPVRPLTTAPKARKSTLPAALGVAAGLPGAPGAQGTRTRRVIWPLLSQ
jgi:hypothetical protein